MILEKYIYWHPTSISEKLQKSTKLILIDCKIKRFPNALIYFKSARPRYIIFTGTLENLLINSMAGMPLALLFTINF